VAGADRVDDAVADLARRRAGFSPGAVLARQGQPGTDIYLVLDGVVRVERDCEPLAEYGPGALLGERAGLEAGVRTASLVAVTRCQVAGVPGGALDRSALEELSGGHRREEAFGAGRLALAAEGMTISL
jgi:CRP-like cAMP-binding protein